jgi:hypothetical protein
MCGTIMKSVPSQIHGKTELVTSHKRPVPLTWHFSKKFALVPLLDGKGKKMNRFFLVLVGNLALYTSDHLLIYVHRNIHYLFSMMVQLFLCPCTLVLVYLGQIIYIFCIQSIQEIANVSLPEPIFSKK